jgi:hypothetical protein
MNSTLHRGEISSLANDSIHAGILAQSPLHPVLTLLSSLPTFLHHVESLDESTEAVLAK